MEAAIDRIMQTYALLMNRSTAASEEARRKVTDYVSKLFEAGEKRPASAGCLRPDLFARTRRQRRSREGGIYGTLTRFRAMHSRFQQGRAGTSVRPVYLRSFHAGAHRAFWRPRSL